MVDAKNFYRMINSSFQKNLRNLREKSFNFRIQTM